MKSSGTRTGIIVLLVASAVVGCQSDGPSAPASPAPASPAPAAERVESPVAQPASPAPEREADEVASSAVGSPPTEELAVVAEAVRSQLQEAGAPKAEAPGAAVGALDGLSGTGGLSFKGVGIGGGGHGGIGQGGGHGYGGGAVFNGRGRGGGMSPRKMAVMSPMPQDPQAGERYASVDENGVVSTAVDRLSTFGIDVDTASYTLMRRDIDASRLPVPDGVRVEEYVNFFEYADPAPKARSAEPFAVTLEGAPSPFRPDRHVVRVGIQGREVPMAQRNPANLVFLIDVSGSMNQANKLPLVKYALKSLVRSLDGRDRVSIVVYAGSDAVLLPPTPGDEREKIIAAIDGLDAGGSTNGEAGIRRAYELASRTFERGQTNRVILCTDGDLNVGLTGEALVKLVEEKRRTGVTFSTFGFGSGNYNDADMEKLANRGNGAYAFIDSRSEAQRVFHEKLVGTLDVIAADTKIQVEFDPQSVASFRLVGYENRKLEHHQFRDDTVDAGEIGAGHGVTALYEVDLRGESPRGPIATVRIRYKEPEGEAAREIARSLDGTMLRERFEDAGAETRFAVAVAEYAQILRGSPFAAGSRMSDVYRIAEGAIDREQSDRAEFLQLVHRAGELLGDRKTAARPSPR